MAEPLPPPAAEADKPTAWAEPAFSIKVIMWGIFLVLLLVGSLATWMLFAPLQNAVIAPGIVSVASHRKQIQHLEGGIVESILINDGDHVSQGQVLIKLRDVGPQAKLSQLERRNLEVQVQIARLLAERDGQEAISLPDALAAQANAPLLASIISGQRSIFQTRQNLFKDQQSVLAHKIAQLQEEITGLQGQLKAKQRERALIQTEADAVQSAQAKGALAQSAVLKVQQSLARIDGDLSGLRADSESRQQSILEIRLKISESQVQRVSDINEELRTLQADFYELTQQIIAAQDILQRTQITSPIDGIVVNLRVHTADGVIIAGQTLLEIVPSGDQLVVYAYIRPEDIKEVRKGMVANIKLLSSLSSRDRIPLTGKVATISADRVTDEQTRRKSYQAQIQLDPAVDALVQANLLAGMGADVYIITGARAPLDYLLAPILKSIQFSLREK